MSGPVRIGVDLGGTKIEAVALGETGEELDRRRVPTPNNYNDTIAAVRDIVAATERAAGAQGTLGIGTPGSASPETGIWRNSNALFLNGTRFGVDLMAALGRPLRIDNDANCFVLSEATDGAGRGRHVVFGVTIGTGFGGGLVLGGRLHRGANAVAGEAGHVPLPWPTNEDLPMRPCYCGKIGCVEKYLCGAGMAADYRRIAGHEVSAADVTARLAAGEEAAEQVVTLFVDRLARVFGVIVTLLDPDIIVVGGGLSNLPGLAERVMPLIPRYVFGGEGRVEVALALQGEASGARGAARLWDDSQMQNDA